MTLIGRSGGGRAQKFPVAVSSGSDYVHDVSHNYNGNRLAMCTSAQQLMVWNKVGDEWVLSATVQYAHNGPIWRLDWAHPEFGQILASCSEDRAIAIWSEYEGGWKKRATLTDSPYAVTDVQFAPRTFGLKLAACCSDGAVRVYHAADPLNLAYWEVEDFSTVAKSTGGAMGTATAAKDQGCTALAWCGSEDRERIAIACQSGYVKVFEKINRWSLVCERAVLQDAPLKDCAWAPNLCRDNEWLAVCGNSDSVEILEFTTGRVPTLTKLHTIPVGSGPVWRVSWNLTGTVLAVAPEKGQAQIWRLAGPTPEDWEKIDEDEDPSAFE